MSGIRLCLGWDCINSSLQRRRRRLVPGDLRSMEVWSARNGTEFFRLIEVFLWADLTKSVPKRPSSKQTPFSTFAFDFVTTPNDNPTDHSSAIKQRKPKTIFPTIPPSLDNSSTPLP